MAVVKFHLVFKFAFTRGVFRRCRNRHFVSFGLFMIAIVKKKTKQYLREFSLLEMLLGLIAVVAFLFLEPYYKAINAPPTDWIEFIRITVPDHNVGDNPMVEHERVAHKLIRGEWAAEIHKLGTKQQVCQSDAISTSEYNPIESRTFATDLRNYINDPDCTLKAGQYTLTLTMRFKVNSFVQKQFYVISPAFKVR